MTTTIGKLIHLTSDEERALCIAIQHHGEGSHPWPDSTTLRDFGRDYVITCARKLLAAPDIARHITEPAATALAKLQPVQPVLTKLTATAIVVTSYTDAGPRLAYAMIDGPHSGSSFYAYDKPTPGTTVTVEYYPDDQFARIRPRTATPSIDDLIQHASEAIQMISDEVFHAAGCNRRSGDRERPTARATPAQCAALLESLASFLSCIAKDDLKTQSYERLVGTLSGLTNGVACDLGMDPDVVGDPVTTLVVHLTRGVEG